MKLLVDLWSYVAQLGDLAEHLIALATVTGAAVWATQTFRQLRKGVAAIGGILAKLTTIEASFSTHAANANATDEQHQAQLDEHQRRLDEHSSLLDQHDRQLAAISKDAP